MTEPRPSPLPPGALPRLITEKEAADALGISLVTMQRLRAQGRIAYKRIGRLVRYTDAQIIDYLEAATCREKAGQAKSGNTGSQNAKTARNGAGPGSIQILDKPAAKALALKTLRPQKSRSRNGSSSTPNARASRLAT